MLQLPGVTLVCVDTLNHALALRALARSRQGVRFAHVLLVTDAIPAGVDVPADVELAFIAPLASREAYSQFVLKSLLHHVTTEHVLLIQWDGYVVNPGAFEPSFLEHDYIGAKWFWFDDSMRVGNGGFSLRSRRLLAALQDPRIELVDAEDITIGRAYRPLLEHEFGIRYASEALADRFAFEAAYPTGMPFGFHGLYNFCRVEPPAELAALAPRLSDAIARSIQFGQLLRNCIALAQWDAAAAFARRRLAAMPADAEAAGLLARAEAGIASGPAVARNDPCPCGSGKRYKQCHGAIGGATPRVQATAGAAVTPAAPRASAGTLAQHGLTLHERGDVDGAERAYRAALALEDEHPLALHYLGVVQHQRGLDAQALPLLERAAALVPQEPEFHNNLGLALAALDRNDEAVAAYRRALERNPAHATAWNNLGLAYQAMNALAEAVDAFRRALALAPAFAHAHWNLALALLAQGQYAEGFREYEWRLRLPELGGNAAALPIARWEAGELRGKSLLLTPEQGIGDALQFVRFASQLATRGVRVIVQARPELCALLATTPGVAATIAADASIPACDAELPLLSLPHRLGVDPREMRETGRYLQSDAARGAAIASRLGPRRPATRRIGIAWAGAPHHRNDRRRSIALATLAPLFALPGIDWHSLQKGPASAQLAQTPNAHDVAPLDADCDLAHTAALVDALDAVVTVDTSIAHLAGALGKPVFVLLPFAPDWRWGIALDRTPWYPSARLFRQPAIGDWRSVVASVHEALLASNAPAVGPPR
jgi:tetratricopeptide (TPR) repeat protein